MANKMTKKDYFARLSAIVSSTEVEDKAELLGFMAHEVELLENKAKGSNSKEKVKKANEVEIVYNALKAVGKPVTVTEFILQAPILQNLVGEGEMLTPQKVTANLTKLVATERVVRTTDKKKVFYSAV